MSNADLKAILKADLKAIVKDAGVDADKKQKQIAEILAKYKDKLPQRIVRLIKIDDPLPSEDESIILKIDKPQVVVDEVIKKFQGRNRKNLASLDPEIIHKIYICLSEISKRVSLYGLSVDKAIYFYNKRTEPDNWKRLLSSLAPEQEGAREYPPPKSPDGDRLREFSNKLLRDGEHIYNTRRIQDDDPKATPLNIFTIKRVNRFIAPLPVNKKLAYLLQLQTNFQEKDFKTIRRVINGHYSCFVGINFELNLQLLIFRFREINDINSQKHQFREEGKAKLDEKVNSSLTARQWALVLRYFINTFGLRHIEVKSFSRLLAVLSGGKNEKDYYDKLRNEKSLITASTVNQAEEMSSLCRELQLTDIAAAIDSAISSIKGRTK